MQVIRSCDDAADVRFPLVKQLDELRASFDQEKGKIERIFAQVHEGKVQNYPSATLELIRIKSALKGIGKILWAPSGTSKQVVLLSNPEAWDMAQKVDRFGRELVDSLHSVKFLTSWCSSSHVRAHALVDPVIGESQEYEMDYLLPARIPGGALVAAVWSMVPPLSPWSQRRVSLEDEVKSNVEYYLTLLQKWLQDHFLAASLWEAGLEREKKTHDGLYALFHSKYQQMTVMEESPQKQRIKAYFDQICFVFAGLRARLNFLSDCSTPYAQAVVKARKAAEAHFKAGYGDQLSLLAGLYGAYRLSQQHEMQKLPRNFTASLVLTKDLYAKLAPVQLKLTPDEEKVPDMVLQGDKDTQVVPYAIKRMLRSTSGIDIELELVLKLVPDSEAAFAKQEEFAEIFKAYRARTQACNKELDQLNGLAADVLLLLRKPDSLFEYAKLIAALDPTQDVVFDVLKFIARRKKHTQLTSCEILLRPLSCELNQEEFNAKVLHLVSLALYRLSNIAQKALEALFEESDFESRLQELPKDIVTLLHAWSMTKVLSDARRFGQREKRFVLDGLVEPFCCPDATITPNTIEIPLFIALADVDDWNKPFIDRWGLREFASLRRDARELSRFLGWPAAPIRADVVFASDSEMQDRFSLMHKLSISEDPVWIKVVTKEDIDEEAIETFLDKHLQTPGYDIELDLFLYRIRKDKALYSRFKALINPIDLRFRHARSDFLLGEAIDIFVVINAASHIVTFAEALQRCLEFARQAKPAQVESHKMLLRFLWAQVKQSAQKLGVALPEGDNRFGRIEEFHGDLSSEPNLLRLTAAARFATNYSEKTSANSRLHKILDRCGGSSPPERLIPLIVDNAMGKAFQREALTVKERELFVEELVKLFNKDILLPCELRGFHALFALITEESQNNQHPVRDAICAKISSAKFESWLANYSKVAVKK